MIKERLTARTTHDNLPSDNLPTEDRLMNVIMRAMAAAAVLLIACAAEAAAPLNIVAIGASNTSGWGVGTQNAYPAVLQTLLRKKGINANVTNAGILGDITAGMLKRLDSVVPNGTNIVILQPGANDLRFFGTKERRAANIAAMVQRLQARHIRVIVYDPDPVPQDFYQWDHIHFNAAAHAKIAATLAAEIEAGSRGQPATPVSAPGAAAAPTTAPAKP
jgi:acyl-CoA thioesterase I